MGLIDIRFNSESSDRWRRLVKSFRIDESQRAFQRCSREEITLDEMNQRLALLDRATMELERCGSLHAVERRYQFVLTDEPEVAEQMALFTGTIFGFICQSETYLDCVG